MKDYNIPMNELTTEDRSDTSSSGNGFFQELFKTGLIVMLIVLPIRLFVAQPFIVSGASMQPTFDTGDYLIIDQISYNFDEPDRGDVVVFRYPNDPSKFYIKRVVGLPGETVQVNREAVTIINKEHPDGFTLDEPYINSQETSNQNATEDLQEDEYFLLGDNRDSSSDSRVWGPLPRDHLVGRAYLRLLPPGNISFTPGQQSAVETP